MATRAEKRRKEYLQQEYQRILPALKAAYAAASPEEQTEIERIDEQFNFHEKPEELVEWARTITPDAFARLAEQEETAFDREAKELEQALEAAIAQMRLKETYAQASVVTLTQTTALIALYVSAGVETNEDEDENLQLAQTAAEDAVSGNTKDLEVDYSYGELRIAKKARFEVPLLRRADGSIDMEPTIDPIVGVLWDAVGDVDECSTSAQELLDKLIEEKGGTTYDVEPFYQWEDTTLQQALYAEFNEAAEVVGTHGEHPRREEVGHRLAAESLAKFSDILHRAAKRTHALWKFTTPASDMRMKAVMESYDLAISCFVMRLLGHAWFVRTHLEAPYVVSTQGVSSVIPPGLENEGVPFDEIAVDPDEVIEAKPHILVISPIPKQDPEWVQLRIMNPFTIREMRLFPTPREFKASVKILYGD